jgi:hypothetical protein
MQKDSVYPSTLFFEWLKFYSANVKLRRQNCYIHTMLLLTNLPKSTIYVGLPDFPQCLPDFPQCLLFVPGFHLEKTHYLSHVLNLLWTVTLSLFLITLIILSKSAHTVCRNPLYSNLPGVFTLLD